ncbi:MAG: hypothetical protein NTX73_09980 [Rhodobacterales bacterium]|jgi:hypothetical protein|nr:hypothetical protein [Rhodobacterales bacterium]
MEPFLGSWALVPELSHYSDGIPPESGLYRISESEGEARFTVDWVKDGVPFSVTFAAPLDGTSARTMFPGVDRFWLETGTGTLVTVAKGGGAVVARAVRRVSGDWSLLSVLQENADGHGGWVRIFQVYRRV